jgi:2-dehydro-3-deoxygluconokinase
MSFDVILLGEMLLELYCADQLTHGATVRLDFSGDTLNAAAAAAAAGARTAVLTTVGDDDVGDGLIARTAQLGIDTSLIRRRAAMNGAYLLRGDLTGQRSFSYWRTGSAASGMDAGDIEDAADAIGDAGAVVLSGIFAALSDGCARAMFTAARLASSGGGAVVYDPNFRARLTAPERAAAALARVAPYCAVVTPSCPGDALPLLGTADPRTAARATLALGARAVAVTCGADAVVAAAADREYAFPVPENPDAVDGTGAGDVFAGTIAARLALGDALPDAISLGIGAAALSVAGRGGTGLIPALAATRAIAPHPVPVG